MIDFIVYNNTSGKILRCGSAPKTMMGLQAHDGESVMEGNADDECDIVDTKTKKVLKDHITSREQIQTSKLAKELENKRESLIQKRIKAIIYKQAEQELILEGEIE